MTFDVGASQVVLLVKNPSGNSGDPRDSGPIPELGRSPGVGNGTLLQGSCLGNSRDGTPEAGGLQSVGS